MSQSESERWLTILRATLDATTDGLLVGDEDGKIVTHNRRFGQMWGIPEPIVASGDDNAALTFVLDQLEDPERFLGVEGVCETIVVPHSDDYGRTVAVIFVHRDVTENKRLEKRLREVQSPGKA